MRFFLFCIHELHSENSRAIPSKGQGVPVMLNSLHMCPNKCQYISLLMGNTKNTPRKLHGTSVIITYLLKLCEQKSTNIFFILFSLH